MSGASPKYISKLQYDNVIEKTLEALKLQLERVRYSTTSSTTTFALYRRKEGIRKIGIDQAHIIKNTRHSSTCGRCQKRRETVRSTDTTMAIGTR